MAIQRITATTLFKGTSIPEVQDWNYTASADQSDHGHSGIATATGVFYDKKRIVVTINSSDTSALDTSNFQQGQTGALVVTSADRSSPDGNGTTRTYTFAEANLDSIAPSVGTGGISGLVYTFTCVKANGSAIIAYS